MDERQWFDTLYHQHVDFLYRIGRRLLGGSAGEDQLLDVVQDVFLTAWQKRRELMIHPNPGGWLTQSLKLRCLGTNTKAQRRALRAAYSLDEEDSAAPAAPASFSPEQQAILESHKQKIREFLGDDQAELFFAFVLEGRTASELSEATGLSQSCIFMRLARAKKKLAQHPEMFYILLIILSEF